MSTVCFILSKEGNREISTASLTPPHLLHQPWLEVQVANSKFSRTAGGRQGKGVAPPHCWTRRGLKAHKARSPARGLRTSLPPPTQPAPAAHLETEGGSSLSVLFKALCTGWLQPLPVRRPERRVTALSLNLPVSTRHRAVPKPGNLYFWNVLSPVLLDLLTKL